jgi:hypothetical protein
MRMEPFRIYIPDERLTVLDRRLREAVWADEAAGASPWDYGVPGDYLRQLVDYWVDEYDWRAQAAATNRWQHVRGQIDGGRTASLKSVAGEGAEVGRRIS